MLSADVCLSVCLSSALRFCVCAGIVSGLVPTLFRSFSEQANGCGAIDESRPGLHSGGLKALH